MFPKHSAPILARGPHVARRSRLSMAMSCRPGVVRKTLQCLLKTYHGADIEVDGDFGRGTQSAVKSFQKAKGLSADGVVGNKTLEALL